MSNQKRPKLPRGFLITVDIAIVLCGGAFIIFVFGGMFTSADADAISNTDSQPVQAVDL